MKTYFLSSFDLIRTALLIVVICLPFHFGWAADQVISGSAAPGNLIVTLHDDGSMEVSQYFSAVPASKLDSGPRQKGSFLFANGQACGLGLFSATGQTVVNNELAASGTVRTTIDCLNLGLRFIQETRYIDFSSEIRYRWTIQNRSAGAVSDIRFFHGTNFVLGLASSTAIGYFDSAYSIVGGIQSDSSGYETALLRSFISPVNFQSGDTPSSVSSSVVTANSLLGGVSDDASVYALQWDMSSLPAGEEFVIEGIEGFNTRPNFDKMIIVSPLKAITLVGQPTTVSFKVKNNGFNPITINSITPSTPVIGWGVTLLNPSSFPVTLAVGDTIVVDVEVDPAGSPAGTEGPVGIDLATGFTASEFALLEVISPPPTATPTSTPTATPTPTIPPAKDIVLTAPLRAVRSDRRSISGTAFAGATIEVIVDGTAVGTTKADANGNWSLVGDVAITLGSHTITVTSTDPFGRKSTLPAPRTFVATAGAILDFDGDGLTDITTYSAIGGSVAFKWKRSSDDSVVTTSIAGRVPATGDGDGDGITDFGTIDRAGQNLLWRVRLSSSSSTIVERVFGEVGDRPLTGCSIVEAGRSSAAVIRKDGSLRAMDFVSGQIVDISTIGKGQILTCADVSGNRLDEVVVAVTKADDSVTVSTRTLAGEVLDSSDGPAFDRAFPVRFGSVDPGAALAVVRLASPGQRRANLVPLATTFTPVKLSLPRKVIFSSGTILDQAGKAVVNVIAQDTAKNRLFRQGILSGDEQVSLGRVAVKSQLLQPQYIYRTMR